MNCKKCGKPLPSGQKGKLCEHCSGQKAHTTKKVVETVGGTVLTIAMIVITGGKISKQ